MHQVKVFDGKGKLKKLINEEALIKREWVKEDKRMLFGAGQHNPPSKIRKNKGKSTRPKRQLWQPVDRICAYVHCNNSFSATVEKKVYCKQSCGERSRLKAPLARDIPCALCGAAFKSVRINALYCRNPCTHALHDKKSLKKYAVSRMASACRPHKSGDMLD